MTDKEILVQDIMIAVPKEWPGLYDFNKKLEQIMETSSNYIDDTRNFILVLYNSWAEEIGLALIQILDDHQIDVDLRKAIKERDLITDQKWSLDRVPEELSEEQKNAIEERLVRVEKRARLRRCHYAP